MQYGKTLIEKINTNKSKSETDIVREMTTGTYVGAGIGMAVGLVIGYSRKYNLLFSAFIGASIGGIVTKFLIKPKQ